MLLKKKKSCGAGPIGAPSLTVQGHPMHWSLLQHSFKSFVMIHSSSLASYLLLAFARCLAKQGSFKIASTRAGIFFCVCNSLMRQCGSGVAVLLLYFEGEAKIFSDKLFFLYIVTKTGSNSVQSLNSPWLVSCKCHNSEVLKQWSAIHSHCLWICTVCGVFS